MTGKFKLIDLKDGGYLLQSGSETFLGDLRTIAVIAKRWGMLLEELEIAVLELAKNDHQIAEFGIRGMFLFTKDAA